MEYLHCDRNDGCLTLHDCVAERAYLEDGKLGFVFPNGFWIMSDHPENSCGKTVRTDPAKVEYTLLEGLCYETTVFVFRKGKFGKTIRTEWTAQKLVERINCGACRLEFLYQYKDENAGLIECWLHLDRKPYEMECQLKLYASDACYYWNHLREDHPW